MTNYDKTFEGVDVIYDKENIPNTLGEVISNNGKTQLRIAETEKYPHVTYFLSGGRELEFEGENRIVASSPKVATYDLKPEMSAFEVTSSCISFTNENNPDFICLNYANPDMVGHTGVPDAILKACETVDQCLKELTTFLVGQNYAVLVIADHGNADKMFNEDGSAHTAHTLNLGSSSFGRSRFKNYKWEISRCSTNYFRFDGYREANRNDRGFYYSFLIK